MARVATLSRASFPNAAVYVGRCTAPGCGTPPPCEYTDETERSAVAYLTGWFRRHVIETGHVVVIETARSPVGRASRPRSRTTLKAKRAP